MPYLLDIQADLLDGLATRVVVPQVLVDAMGAGIKQLHPHFKVKGQAVVLSTAELAGVSARILGEKQALSNPGVMKLLLHWICCLQAYETKRGAVGI